MPGLFPFSPSCILQNVCVTLVCSWIWVCGIFCTSRTPNIFLVQKIPHRNFCAAQTLIHDKRPLFKFVTAVFFAWFSGTFGRIYHGILHFENEEEEGGDGVNQEIYIKTVSGGILMQGCQTPVFALEYGVARYSLRIRRPKLQLQYFCFALRWYPFLLK